VDAVGGTSVESHRASLERIMQARAFPVSWVQLICEMQRDWSREQNSEMFAGILFSKSRAALRVKASGDRAAPPQSIVQPSCWISLAWQAQLNHRLIRLNYKLRKFANTLRNKRNITAVRRCSPTWALRNFILSTNQKGLSFFGEPSWLDTAAI
jgi:hypothetical protein